MNLFDPDRPKSHSQPAYLSPLGRPIAPWPHWRLELDQGQVRLSAFLLISHATGREFAWEGIPMDLESLLLQMEENPEAALISLGYDGSWKDQTPTMPMAKSTVTLAELEEFL